MCVIVRSSGISYSVVVVYIRGHEDLGFSGKTYHPKTFMVPCDSIL